MSELQRANKLEAVASGEQSALSTFVEHAYQSLKYNLLQAPLSGVTQLHDHFAQTKHLRKVQFFKQPQPVEFGSAGWAGDLVGGTGAAVVQLGILHRLVGPGAAAKFEVSTSYGLRTAAPSIGKSILTGMFVGGVLTPVNENDPNFITARLCNAGVTGLTFGALTAGSVRLKSTGRAGLVNDMVASGMAGVPAGLIDADLRSSLINGRVASWQERIQSVVNFSVGGALAGGVNTLHEYIIPTSGIRAVRTAEDMKRLADSTVKPGHPERWAFDENQAIPPKPDQLLTAEAENWYDRAAVAVRREINGSTMPLALRKLVVSGNQEMAYGLEALSNRSNPKPIMTIYGSARIPEGDFRFERARYTGGRAVQEGYDVMTGGAPGGIMLAGNKGAYEAGGTSIGVVLKLPFENGDKGNGFQTLTLKHRNFHTRMQILKTVAPDGVIVVEEGGIGTGAEALDTLTHMQTGKMEKVPVYFIGSKAWKPLDNLLHAMEKSGTISPSDRKLYRIVDNPDQMFEELARRRATKPGDS